MNSNSNAPFGREDFFIKACFGSEGPQGPAGAAGQGATVSVGKVETVQAGQSAQVLNSGTAKDAVLDFKIPKGQDGESVSLRSPHYDSYEDLAAQHPAGTAGEAYLVGEVNFIYVWDANTNSWVSVGKLGYLPQIFTDFREDVLEELSERYTKNETDGLISAHNLSPEAHADIRQALETLQLLKLVDVLPAQGESKYIYAVPQDERTTDGQLIVVLFIWTGTEWAAVGALTTSVDLTDYLKKTEAQNTYLPKQNPSATGTAKIKSVLQLVNSKGIVTFSLAASDMNYIQKLSKPLGVPPDYQISRYNGTSYSDNVLWSADKGVSGGVASLGTDGKVPQEQLPNVSAATPVTGLGQVTSASFEVNKNYAASVSGTAAFTLPTPADSTIANKITLSLNVLANSVINWGANVNAALAEFTPGKYQIRLLWNNTSSAWSAEVLKETAAVGDTVVLCHFDGNCSSEAGGAVINQLANPNQVTWEELTPGFGLAAKNAMSSAGALFQFDAHESLVLDGDFTIEFTVKNPNAGSNSEYTMEFTDKIVYETLSATSERHGIQCHGWAAIAFGGKLLKSSAYDGSTAKKAVVVVRSGDTLYYYENGSLVMSGTGWQGVTLDLRGWYMSGITAGDKAGMVIDELRISRSAKYLTNYTPATAPFVLADSGVSDLHDIKMAELYSSISALQNELQILKGQSMKRLDYTNAVQFYLKEKDQTSYTVPANGYIFGYGFQTYNSGTNSYRGNILINGINIGIYFKNYTLSSNQVNIDIPLSMPLPVSAGDVITITGNREAFQAPYLFVPEKEDQVIGA